MSPLRTSMLRSAWTALVMAVAPLLLVPPAGCGDDGEQGPAAPAILPQQSPYDCGPVPIIGATADAEKALGQQRTFTIQLSNSGGRPLIIEQARILGDLRCSFSQPAILRASAFSHGRSALLLIGYRPSAPGDDDVMLEVTSNASNFPVLHVPICGTGYDPAGERPEPRRCHEPASLELNPACPLTPEPAPAG